VQANALNHLPTRICVALVAEEFLKPERRLNPQIEIDGQKYYIHPSEIATFPTKLLRRSVANLEGHRDKIIAALDIIFLGI